MNIDGTRQQIIDEKGHLIVQGGPGSGKTTIALEKTKGLKEVYTKNQKILFLSFSKSAVKQIADRAKDIFKDSEQSGLVIQTYHSFCWEVLKSHFYLLSNAKKIEIMPPHVEVILKNTFDGEDWDQHLENEFTNEGKIVYDLFAPKVLELFSRSKALLDVYCKAHPLIIVDEFQDSDKHQWEIVKLLANQSQIMCLADPDQRIYDGWRPGVSLKRIEEVITFLKPKSFDFENQNHRSPNGGILSFANSLLRNPSELSYPTDGSLKLVQYPIKQMQEYIKLQLYALIKKMPEGKKDWSIAILVKTNKMVRTISNGLDSIQTFKTTKLEPFTHSVLIDENAVVLSGRIIAFLMQPKQQEGNKGFFKTIDLFIDIYNSKITQQNTATVIRLMKAKKQIEEGKSSSIKLIQEIERIRMAVQEEGYLSGDPFLDWLKVRKELELSQNTDVAKIAKTAKQMRYLRRGTQITDVLSRDWRTNGCYLNALSDFDNAVFQAQISDGYTPHTGVIVMNIHKSKGKEFDGVLLIDGQYGDSLVAYDKAPYTKSRRLVRVGLTRAKTVTYILACRQYPSELFPR